METDARLTLEFQQEELKRQIAARLDLLQGRLNKSPSQAGYHWDRKIGGKTVTRSVRKSLVPMAGVMVQNHRRVKQLLAQLSDVNWRWLQLSLED
jgi:hypothetical protein